MSGRDGHPPGSLYERYRDALRGGHLAVLRGNRDVATRAYLEAAALLPDRAAPYVSLGKAELAADRRSEALAAFESALARAPSDTAALEGAARALSGLERPRDAADMLDRLAITLLEQDRHADALATVERAIDLADSPWRRSAIDQLRAAQGAIDSPWLGDLGASPGGTGHGPAAHLEPDEAGLRADVISDELRRLAEDVESASAAGDVEGLVRGANALARAGRLRAAIDACHDALTLAPADPDVHRALAVVYRRRGLELAARQKLVLVDRYLEIVDDPHELDRLADGAEMSGDLPGLLAIASRHAERGRIAASLELCFRALAIAPGDVGVHLSIARAHLASGWRRRAVEEVARLARLVDLAGDDAGRVQVAAFVNRELETAPGSPRPVG